MAITDFDLGTWTDPWVRKLSSDAKLLFVYLWTNTHKNTTGMYIIGEDTMSFETGITRSKIPSLLASLSPQVLYDEKESLCWVVNHVKRQFLRTGNVSPKIVKSFETILLALPERHPFIGEFLSKYDTLSIRYPYPIDRVSIPYAYPPKEGEGVYKDLFRENTLETKKQETKSARARDGLLDVYATAFYKKFEHKPSIVGDRDGKIMKDMVEAHGREMVEVFIREYFAYDDEYVRSRGYDIPTLKARVQQLVVKIKTRSKKQETSYAGIGITRDVTDRG